MPAGPWNASLWLGGARSADRGPLQEAPQGQEGCRGAVAGMAGLPYRAPAPSWPRPPPAPSSRGGEAGAGLPGPSQGHPAEVRAPVCRPGARGRAWGLSGKGWVREPTAQPRPSSRPPWRPSCALPPGVTEGRLALSPCTQPSRHPPPTSRPPPVTTPPHPSLLGAFCDPEPQLSGSA